MSERIFKFIACLFLVPLGLALLFILIPLLLLLPIIALIYPDVIKINDK